MKKNTIATQGLVLSENEYEVLSRLIAASAQHVKGKQPEIYTVLQRILGRMSQSVQHGAGLRPEDAEIYRKRIHDAFAAQSETALKLAVEDLITSTLRTDADPGLKVARYLMELVGQLLEAQSRNGMATLERLQQLLAESVEEWTAEGWPPAADAVAWVVDTVQIGIDDLALGQQPWVDESEDADNEGEAET